MRENESPSWREEVADLVEQVEEIAAEQQAARLSALRSEGQPSGSAPADYAKMVELSDITPLPDTDYPRIGGAHQDTIEHYRNNLDRLPPITIAGVADEAHHGKLYLLDGLHRYHACQRNGQASISAIVRPPFPAYSDLVLAAYEANAQHGRPLTVSERERGAKRLFNLGVSTEGIARTLGIHPATARRYTAAQRRARKEAQRQQAKDMTEQGASRREIAEELGVSLSTVRNLRAEEEAGQNAQMGVLARLEDESPSRQASYLDAGEGPLPDPPHSKPTPTPAPPPEPETEKEAVAQQPEAIGGEDLIMREIVLSQIKGEQFVNSVASGNKPICTSCGRAHTINSAKSFMHRTGADPFHLPHLVFHYQGNIYAATPIGKSDALFDEGPIARFLGIDLDCDFEAPPIPEARFIDFTGAPVPDLPAAPITDEEWRRAGFAPRQSGKECCRGCGNPAPPSDYPRQYYVCNHCRRAYSRTNECARCFQYMPPSETGQRRAPLCPKCLVFDDYSNAYTREVIERRIQRGAGAIEEAAQRDEAAIAASEQEEVSDADARSTPEAPAEPEPEPELVYEDIPAPAPPPLPQDARRFRADLSAAEQHILSVIGEETPTFNELLDRCGMPEGAITRMVVDMMREGFIVENIPSKSGGAYDPDRNTFAQAGADMSVNDAILHFLNLVGGHANQGQIIEEMAAIGHRAEAVPPALGTMVLGGQLVECEADGYRMPDTPPKW